MVRPVRPDPVSAALTRHPLSITFTLTMLYALALMIVSGVPLW
ncbi:hypothetical protein [Pseudonocardia sp. NPDC049635]